MYNVHLYNRRLDSWAASATKTVQTKEHSRISIPPGPLQYRCLYYYCLTGDTPASCLLP